MVLFRGLDLTAHFRLGWKAAIEDGPVSQAVFTGDASCGPGTVFAAL